MGGDVDGREKLKRARKLLGNADINKSDSESEPGDPTPPVPPAKETQAPAGDRSQPSQETASPPLPPTTPTAATPELSISSPVAQPIPASMQAPIKPTTPPQIPKEGAETIKGRKFQGKGGEAPTVEEAPLAGAPAATSTVQPELPSKGTASTSLSLPTAETPNHSLYPEKDELIDSLPKTAWGVKVTMKDFVFIRDHDKYCVLLKDPRTFREKFVEWMRNLEASVTPELAAAREVTLSARKAVPSPAPNNPDGDSGDHL